MRAGVRDGAGQLRKIQIYISELPYAMVARDAGSLLAEAGATPRPPRPEVRVEVQSGKLPESLRG